MDQVATDKKVANGALEDEVAAVVLARERLGLGIDRLDAEVRAQVAGGVQKTAWKVGATLAGVLAAAAVRKGLTVAWRSAMKNDPPHDPSSPDTTWGEALAWTVATAIGVGIARLIVDRGAVAGWERATGSRPPGR